MYLVSIYFDEKTNRIMKQFINKVAAETGNTYMLDGQVPPHITISAFETRQEEKVIALLEKGVKELHAGTVQWTSIGVFLPYVLYLAPVLNSYLHNLSVIVYESVKSIDDIQIRPNYQPFQWMPHTTIGKKLSKDEMQIAFSVMQKSFGMFSGEVVRIGLAKTNPYRDIIDWELNF